jgi:hypothetical protein
MEVERSSYVCAGFESFTEMINNFMLNKRESFADHFTREDIANFFGSTCNKFLHSYGQNFSDCRTFSKYSLVEADKLQRCRDTKFFSKSEFILDSGGFQISINRIPRKNVQTFIDLYHDFLVNYPTLYDRAFVLDVPPGPGCEVFHSFKDVYDLNLQTYTRAANLPQQVKDRMIYIHHFRTPKLWEIYTKIMVENNLFNQFNYNGTGGIVANRTSDIIIPCIIYVLPLIPLLNQCKKHNRKKLNFHILGGANFRDIVFYEFFKIHILETHGIEVDITYDSSGVFKSLIVARHFLVFDEENGCVNRLNLRSSTINTRFKKDKKVRDVVSDELMDMAKRHNFKKIDVSTIYNDETGTFFDDVKSYLMLHLLDTYAKVQTFGKNMAQKIYPYYKNGDLESFSKLLFELTRDINNEKITQKQSTKTQNMIKSLNMLTNLDEDYCKFLVDKILSGDEFTDLFQNDIIKF